MLPQHKDLGRWRGREVADIMYRDSTGEMEKFLRKHSFNEFPEWNDLPLGDEESEKTSSDKESEKTSSDEESEKTSSDEESEKTSSDKESEKTFSDEDDEEYQSEEVSDL